jgi:hypothetical protein
MDRAPTRRKSGGKPPFATLSKPHSKGELLGGFGCQSFHDGDVLQQVRWQTVAIL